eukprot:jgi/Tetstr1/445437/TSEL_033218.t2
MSICMQIGIEESADGLSAVVIVFESALKRRLQQVPLAELPGDFVIRLQVLADATMIYKKGEVKITVVVIKAIACMKAGTGSSTLLNACELDLGALRSFNKAEELGWMHATTVGEDFLEGSYQLSTTLPAEWSELTALQLMMFEGNGIRGSLPPEWSTLTGMKLLGMTSQDNTGILPPEYSEWARLEHFAIQENMFSGSLPPEYSAWARMDYLSLYFNPMLEGHLPPQYSTMTRMTVYDIEGNSHTGAIPAEYSTMVRMSALYLGGNLLTGALPAQLSTMTRLDYLDISLNELSATLPVQYSTLERLYHFQGDNAGLVGPLPAEWSTLNGLEDIDLGLNRLTGTLPGQWSALSSLRALDLSGNQLEGGIPLEWGLGLSGMACLRLDQAQLEGDCVPDMLMLAVIEGSDGYFPTVPCYLNFTSSDNDTAWELGSPPMPPLCDNCTSEYPGQAPPAPPSSFLMWLQADVTQMFYRRHLSGQVTEEDWGSLAGWAQVAVTALAQDLADMSGVSRESVAIVAAEVVVYGRVIVTCTLPFPSESDAILANLTLAGYGIGSTSYFDHLAAEGFFVTLQHVAIAEVRDLSPMKAAANDPEAGRQGTNTGSRHYQVDMDSAGVMTGKAFSTAPSSPVQPGPPSSAWSGTLAPPQSLSTSGLAALAGVILQGLRAAQLAAVQTSAYAPLAACITAVYLQSARRLLLLLAFKSTSNAAAPGASRMPQLAAGRGRGTGASLRRSASGTAQDAGLQLVPLAEREATFAAEGTDFHVSYKAELRGKLGIKLGAGAFGQVYKAHWRGLDVAVKMFHSSADVDERAQILSFKAELKTMAELSKGSERIVRMYGACLTPPNVCIIYEYVPGGSLHDRIYSDFSLPLSALEVLRIGRDIAEGLSFMHPVLVHRDLKPHNILLDASGRAKICDFGLSRKKDPLQSYLVTEAGGTPFYMAPEVFTAQRTHDKADIYALAVILNEAMSSSPPWSFETPFQVIYAVSVKKKRPAISARCPPSAARLIEKCWAEDVNKRPTAAELVVLIDHIVRDLQGSPPT